MKCQDCKKNSCFECGECGCNEINWIKWSKENLPPVGKKVLLVYKSGFHGCIEFFTSDFQKEMHIKGMEFNQKKPEADLGIIGNMIRDFDNDPIMYWMPFPELPEMTNEME